MADEKGTQKPKERVKYKFGQNDIDLTNYIHNLGTNVQSYLNSKNWNEGQKQEFMNAYNRYLTGLQDQLANNTNRFTTDDFGSIIDSTGALSNTDNDDIDPVGSEYYYDNKGNRITTDDFNLLKKRKQKNYNTFSANREVATYFNTIGNALKGMETPKEKVQDAFNLSKHGFLADWTTANNPAGGDFNLDPYLEKDAMDETTGKRGTSNRAAYLKEQIENYINNIGEYDFSSSPFKNRDTYISRLRAAAQNLENGYNSEDVIALNQAGIGNEFLSKFFATGAEEAPIKKSELELQAEQAAKEQAEREKEDQLRAVIKANEEDKYNRERDAFFADYAAQNPFQSTISGYVTPSYNLQGTYNWLQGRYKFDAGNMDATKEAVKTYINFPELASIIRGGKKTNDKGDDITALHIANNLDLAAQSDLLTDKVGDTGYYVVPGSENYDNWSYIAYNPVTRQYQEQSMLLNEELKKKMAYAEYDRRHKGVQKHQLGGIAKYVEENQKKAQKEAEKQRRIDEKVEETGKTREQVEAAERRPMEEGFSTIDKVRLGTAAADAAAAAAAFIPGYGTVASGVLGIGSTLTNIGADIADESMSGWDVAGNALYGLGMDVVGLIPGLGTTGKAAKIVRVLKPVSKLAMRTLQAYGMIHSADAFNKLMSNPSDMSADDWRNLVTGLQAISGEARYKGGKRAVSRATTQRDVADVKTSTGRVATISKEDLDKLRKTKGLKAQNKLFSELTGGQQLQREFKDREINWKKPWKSRLSSDSPEVSLRTESSFLPEDNSWDARLFRGMNRNTPQRKPQKKQQETQQPRFDRLRQLSSQTGKLTPQEIATINRQRVKSGKGKLTEQEIQALNQRRQNRAGDGTDNSFQARLQRYKDAKREGKFTSVEDDIKRAKDELAEATRQQRLAVPTGQGEIVSPDANQARFIMGFSRAIPTVNPSRPPISNPLAIIPKQQVRIEQPQQSPFNYDRIREGLARAERERLGKDIGEQRLQRAIEANPERSARLQSEEAYRNVRQAFNLYGAPQYKRPLTGAAYKAKQDMYNRLFNQRRYDVIEAFRNRELPHRQSNKKKKTSRDDRRTVKREDGGTLDLVRVRKFQNAGKFPEWYSKLYKFQNLTGWNNSLNQSLAGPSITNENAGHYRAGDLNEAYTKNNSYTSNPNLVGQDLQSYYDSSFKGKSLDDYVSAYNANAAKIRGYWDQERTYKQSGAQEHNRLFKNMFGNRSDNSNNVWNIGYDSNLEDIVGSSTWLRRMDRYEKEFDNLSDEEKKSRIHKIDLGDGNFGYVYKKANGDIAVWNQPETPATSTNPADSQTTPTITSVIQPSQEPSDDNKQNKSFFSNINPTIAYGLPRAVYADRMNRRITDLAKESVVPLLKDPFEVHRYTRSDLDAEMQGERNYANLRRLASRPITSDGSLQTATQLQAEVQGQEARTAGKEKSNQVQRQYDELAWQQEKENAANRHETAMFNRAQQWGADQDKSKYEQAYLAKKFNIWDVFGQQLEYDARTKQKENKALADNFARSDIHNAISYAPNDYGANLTPDELTVWNKVLSGTNPSSLSSQEFNSYKLAAQKVSRVETEQLRQYYNVPNTRWSGKTPSTHWSPTISKAISAKNGAKIAVAGIEAKTADAERFQKQIKECIDRNEKAIDRLSKSLYGLIKASMIK